MEAIGLYQIPPRPIALALHWGDTAHKPVDLLPAAHALHHRTISKPSPHTIGAIRSSRLIEIRSTRAIRHETRHSHFSLLNIKAKVPSQRQDLLNLSVTKTHPQSNRSRNSAPMAWYIYCLHGHSIGVRRAEGVQCDCAERCLWSGWV